MHGLLHISFQEGLPHYTFLLDDQEEVLSAKLCSRKLLRGHYQPGALCRYAFYSLTVDSSKRKGWKSWQKKDKLSSKLIAQMRVSSVLSASSSSVCSEFVLSSSAAGEKLGTGAIPSLASSSSSSSSTSTSSSSSSPVRLALTVPHFRRNRHSANHLPHVSPQWSSQLGISRLETMNKSLIDSGDTPFASVKCLLNALDESVRDHTSVQIEHAGGGPNEPELAAIVITVPVETEAGVCPHTIVQGKPAGHTLADLLINAENEAEQVTQCEPNIRVILPAGMHGGNLGCTLGEGPTPLIERWRGGGTCDCKGWDLGCGLILLANSKSPQSSAHQNKPLMLYLNKEEEEGDGHCQPSLSLLPCSNGLISLEFRQPLSPLQAFSVVVSLLHGRETPSAPLHPHQRQSGLSMEKSHPSKLALDCVSCLVGMPNLGSSTRTSSSSWQQLQFHLNEYER